MADNKLTTRTGAPVVDNQNILTAGKRGPTSYKSGISATVIKLILLMAGVLLRL